MTKARFFSRRSVKLHPFKKVRGVFFRSLVPSKRQLTDEGVRATSLSVAEGR